MGIRKTIEIDALTKAFDELEELLFARKDAAEAAGDKIRDIEPDLYYGIVRQGAFALLKEARKLAGYKS